MSKKSVRNNKSKKDIVSDIQLVQDAERRRSLIKDVFFPHLGSFNETVGYTKVFIQAYSGLINGVYEEERKKTTVAHLMDSIVEKLNSVFDTKDSEQKKEYDRYIALSNLIKDVSIQDLSYASEMPRYIDGFLMKKTDKELFSSVPIEEILGK